MSRISGADIRRIEETGKARSRSATPSGRRSMPTPATRALRPVPRGRVRTGVRIPRSCNAPSGLSIGKSPMIFRDNPVLIRELLVNLRSNRAFTLQLLYVTFLGVVVYFAWPSEGKLVSADLAQRLF